MQTEPKVERNSQNGAVPQEPAGAAAPPPGQPQAVGAEASPAEVSLAEQLEDARAEIARLKEEYLRALAETENVRRRAARDRQEASQYSVSGFARDLLSVADNLQRALQSVDAEARQREPALEALLNGVAMTERELATVLERHGIRRIEAHGSQFDPHVHEAMFEVPDPNVTHGSIVHVLQEGYTLHERTLRPARVGIARGGPKPGAQPEAPAAPAAEAVAKTQAAPEPQPAGEQTAQEGGAYRQAGEGTPGARLDETT